MHQAFVDAPNEPGCDPASKPWVTRLYDYPCGGISYRLCKDQTRQYAAQGDMKWQVCDQPFQCYDGGPGVCVEGNNGNTWHFHGLPFRTNGVTAASGIIKWRHESCASSGYREIKGGAVKCCQATTQVDLDYDELGSPLF
jgi:hypothetical protein